MREIRFRAWDTKRKKWGFDIGVSTVFLNDIKSTEPYTLTISRENGNYVYQQYTGLRDKDGTEIYEGDIVYWKQNQSFSSTFIVRYGDSAGDDLGVAYGWNIPDTYKQNIIVLGNIYDNPELLK